MTRRGFVFIIRLGKIRLPPIKDVTIKRIGIHRDSATRKVGSEVSDLGAILVRFYNKEKVYRSTRE